MDVDLSSLSETIKEVNQQLREKNDDLEKLKTFVNTLQVFTLGVSWGGFESLALPVYKGKNQEDIVKRGLKLTHVRMYAGLEHPDTLIQDIKQALDVAYGTV